MPVAPDSPFPGPNAQVLVPPPAPVVVQKERRFPCHGCGADLVFAPGQNVLACPHCGHTEKIPQTAEEIKAYSFNDYLARPRGSGYGRPADTAHDLRCAGCGALTHMDVSLRATTCAFCGAPLVLDEKADGASAEDVIAPEALVPFQITREQSHAAFNRWIAGLWFAPSALQHEDYLKELQGIYRPFWTYDAHTITHWTGERGDAYWETETYTTQENGRTVTRTRQVRKIRWTFVSGVFSRLFDDVLISAGRNTDYPTAFRLGAEKHYEPAYLSGFVAERYVVSCEAGWQQAKTVINSALAEAVRREIGGDEQRVQSVDTAFSGITYKHILLPLWLSSYRYRGKAYQFQVNGQTGEVAGARPYSVWKILLLTAAVLAAGAVVYYLIR